jgi:hypothetical protein
MASDDKAKPTLTPGPPELADRLDAALTDEATRRALVVKMTIRGGLQPQAYAFDFVAHGGGNAECSFEDRLHGASCERTTLRLSPDDFRDLLKKIQGALRLPHEQPSFLPDTVLGILEVSDGRDVRRLYFAADPEQAKTQGQVPPRELRTAIDAIYAAAARVTGQRLRKP